MALAQLTAQGQGLRACTRVRGSGPAPARLTQTLLVPTQSPCRHHTISRATGSRGGSSSSEGEDVVSRLNQLIRSEKLTAMELRQLVLDKWGRSYDIRLLKRDSKMYLQIMWKFLEQQSFHLTEQEYMDQLEAVSDFINDWGVAETVRYGIQTARPRGPGYTGGTNARCVSIPLDVDLQGSRSSEWN